MDTKPNVAILGLGTMGHGMAVNLLKAGFPLAVYNRTAAKAEPLAAHGATIASTPAQAARSASVVISMLADDEASRAAWLGTEAALSAMEPDSIAVECSTVSPEWIEELHAKTGARGVRLVEAPVTGSRTQAEAGQLTFLAGSDPDTLERVTPVLRCMSKDILHLGPVGGGTQLKLINNFLCGVQAASFAEGLAWIERTGLNREIALEFLKNGAPGSGIFKAMADRMTRRTYEVNFLLRLMEKDLRYAHAAAARQGVELTTVQPAQAMFRAAEQQGHGNQDMAAVVEILRAETPRT